MNECSYKRDPIGPGQVAQFVKMASPTQQVASLILGQSIYKQQPMNAQIGGTTKSMFLSLSNECIKKNWGSGGIGGKW